MAIQVTISNGMAVTLEELVSIVPLSRAAKEFDEIKEKINYLDWLQKSHDKMAANISKFFTLRHISEYHEDMGNMLWWVVPLDEPPYCGTPLDSDWPGYHEWFSEFPIPPNSHLISGK